ncbi:hypothetical protein QAD02_001114 [Eretmocerus hayati]|uniref:Uncharacterized protein n=1 Tax=Eretmocerus hayati TaxID=131215 RepID=A0ACC2NJW8_9HYME|nr:hypothetical protein QAD02_001114 [Eretmocerus hayati]
MRRTHSGYGGYEPVPTSSSHSLEEENDGMAEELRGKIQALKSLSIDIGSEVKFQNGILHDMDDDFERTNSTLFGSMSRVLRLAKGRHNYYTVYLFLFALVVFFTLWIFIK